MVKPKNLKICNNPSQLPIQIVDYLNSGLISAAKQKNKEGT